MADLADQQTEQLLRRIIREEVRPIIREEVRPIISEEVRSIMHQEIRPIIQEEIRPIIQQEVRPIIRDEVTDIRQDVATIKQVQLTQGMQLRGLQTDVNSLKAGYRRQARETSRLATLFEDFETKFQAVSELKA